MLLFSMHKNYLNKRYITFFEDSNIPMTNGALTPDVRTAVMLVLLIVRDQES
jgi:hypothetical protein